MKQTPCQKITADLQKISQAENKLGKVFSSASLDRAKDLKKLICETRETQDIGYENYHELSRFTQNDYVMSANSTEDGLFACQYGNSEVVITDAENKYESRIEFPLGKIENAYSTTVISREEAYVFGDDKDKKKYRYKIVRGSEGWKVVWKSEFNFFGQVRFYKSGDKIISRGLDSANMYYLSRQDGKQLTHILLSRRSMINHVTFGQNGNIFAIEVAGHGFTVFDKNYRVLRSDASGVYYHAQMDSKGENIAFINTGRGENILKILNIESGETIEFKISELTEHYDSLPYFLNDGKIAILIRQDNARILVFDPKTKLTKAIDFDPGEGVTEMLYILSDDRIVLRQTYWDPQDRNKVRFLMIGNKSHKK